MGIKKINPGDPESASANVVEENVKLLKRLFPELVTEGEEGWSVNVDVLKQLVGDRLLTDADEKYGLNWFGKRRARQLALTPSTGTLRPAPEESEDWDTTQNLFIEGDNLEVLKLLQKSYAGKVKLIYIDPPYNTGNDFVYKDDFRDNIRNYKKLTGQVDENDSPLTTNTEIGGRFHTDWLNMMYPRLLLTRNLLKEDGIIFISIDDNEVANLRKICDEVFGEESFVANIHIEISTTQGMKIKAAKKGNIVKNGEHILVYSKNGRKDIGLMPLLNPTNYDNHYSQYLIPIEKEEGTVYDVEDLDTIIKQQADIMNELSNLGLVADINSKIDISRAYHTSAKLREFVNKNADYIVRTHDTIELPLEFAESIDDELVREYNSDTRKYLVYKSVNGKFYQKIRLSDKLGVADDFYKTYGPTTIRGDWWSGFYLDMGNVNKEGGIPFHNGKKPIRLIEQLLKFTTKENDIIMDYFAGSGTTGHAVMAQNADDGGTRRYLLIQLPEPIDSRKKEQKAASKICAELGLPQTVAELTKERLRRAAKMIKDEHPDWDGDTGFRVYKLDNSNIKAWNPQPEDLERQLEDMINPLLPDRTPEDVLYELLLKLGLDLCVPIEARELVGKTIYSVGGGVLMTCLDKDITTNDVERLGQGIVSWRKELAPAAETTVVFLDSAFENDVAKANLVAILEQGGITNIRSL